MHYSGCMNEQFWICPGFNLSIYFLPSASPYVSNCPGLLRTFCRLFLILCQIILGTLIRPGSIFAYETSMQEFTAITDSCMGCADFVHDMCVVHNLFLSPNKVAVDR